MPRPVLRANEQFESDWVKRVDLMKQQASDVPAGRARDALLKQIDNLENAISIRASLMARGSRGAPR